MKKNLFEFEELSWFLNSEDYKIGYPGFLSKDQVSAHCVHHQNYETALKEEVKNNWNNDFSNLPKIMYKLRHKTSCATQFWYHNVFWNNLTNKQGSPGPVTLKHILESYHSLENLKDSFISTGLNHFSNGWYVLGFHKGYPVSLKCLTFKDGIAPMTMNFYPILVMDLWEHSYYLDYKWNKKEYLQAAWNKINWEVVEDRLVNSEKYMQSMEGFWS